MRGIRSWQTFVGRHHSRPGLNLSADDIEQTPGTRLSRKAALHNIADTLCNMAAVRYCTQSDLPRKEITLGRFVVPLALERVETSMRILGIGMHKPAAHTLNGWLSEVDLSPSSGLHRSSGGLSRPDDRCASLLLESHVARAAAATTGEDEYGAQRDKHHREGDEHEANRAARHRQPRRIRCAHVERVVI